MQQSSKSETILFRQPNITPVAVFARFQDRTGRVSNVGLQADRLCATSISKAHDDPLGSLMKAAHLVLNRDYPAAGRAVAFVGIGWMRLGFEDSDADFRRGDFDEAKHPREPKGTPEGGEFVSTDGDSATETANETPDLVGERQAVHELKQTIERKAARKLVKLRLIAGLRAIAGIAADAVPFAGEAFDAYEIARTVADFADLKKLTEVALDYAKGGPKALSDLRVSETNVGFSSPDAFVKDFVDKRFGSADEGYDYHHIVPQGGANASKISPEQLHSTENMIRVPRLLHEAITEAYASPSKVPGMSIRQWLATQSFEVQYEAGVQIMRELGIVK
jgi:hypothetical protein